MGLPAELDPAQVLSVAQAGQLDILTTAATLSSAPYLLHLPFNRSIVYLQLEGGDVEQDDAIDRLFSRYKRLTPNRLYTVTASRVKVRQLPSSKGISKCLFWLPAPSALIRSKLRSASERM